MRTEVVRNAVDALNRGDWEAVFADVAPDVVYDLSRTDSPLRGVYHGADAVRATAAEFFSPWESVRYEVHELVEAGDEVTMRYTSRFRREGLELEARATWVWTFRGEQVTRLTLIPE